MPRKPNYKFERMERQRAKAAKKATRDEAKREKADKRNAENADLGLAADGSADSPIPGESADPPRADDDPNR